MSDNTRERPSKPDGWHRKRWPYSGTLERRQAVVRLACFTLDGKGLPLGGREASRRSGVPRSTISNWIEWEPKPLWLLPARRALSPTLAHRWRRLWVHP